MENLAHAANEPNSHNSAGVCTAIYSKEPMSIAEVEEALKYVLQNRSKFKQVSLPTMVDSYLSVEERPTDLSKKAGWHRYECNGSC